MAAVNAHVEDDGRSAFLLLPLYKVTLTSSDTKNFITMRHLSRRNLQERLRDLAVESMWMGHDFTTTGLSFGKNGRASLY